MRCAPTVATAPPKRFSGGGYWFSGGGYWEAMHGDMTGWFGVRVDGPRHHYRLYCLLDYEAADRHKPVVITVLGSTRRLNRGHANRSDHEIQTAFPMLRDLLWWFEQNADA